MDTYLYAETYIHPTDYIENNVCTRVSNCFSAQERIILVLISGVAEQRGQ